LRPYDPVLNWDNGYPAFNGTLPSKDPALQNNNGVSWTLPGSLAQGYVQNWNFGVQRELFKSTTIEANYIGNKGTRLPTGQPSGNCYLPCLYNALPSSYLSLGDTLRDDISLHPEIPKPFPSFQGTVAQALRPYPQYTTIGLTGYNVGSSTYNALQLTVRKRPSKGGLGFIIAYTVSKALNDSPDSVGYNYNFQDFYNRGAEKAIATFNQPQDLKITWIWELPVGKGHPFLNRGGIPNAILGGWSLSAIQRYSSGSPVAVVDYNYDPGVIFTDVFRPDRVPGVDSYQKSNGYDLANGSTWINPNAFVSVPASPGGVPVRPGNSPRVLEIYGPWSAGESLAIMKTFPIRESMSFQVRADADNIFNRTYRYGPDTDLSSPDFGKITGVYGNRSFQFSGRFRF